MIYLNNLIQEIININVFSDIFIGIIWNIYKLFRYWFLVKYKRKEFILVFSYFQCITHKQRQLIIL